MRVQAYLAERELDELGEKIIVPTNDLEVQSALEVFQQPSKLDEERKDERRKRLRRVMAWRQQKGLPLEWKTVEEPEDEPMTEFWTNGSEELQVARENIASTSRQRAEIRLLQQRREKEDFDSDISLSIENIRKSRFNLGKTVATLQLYGTQVGFDRPVSSVSFYKNLLAAGDWSGKISLLNASTLEVQKSLSGAHQGAISGLDWDKKGILASAGAEGDVRLQNFDSMSCSLLKGHSARVAQVKWHPQAPYLATSSYDSTWRLWDATHGVSLLEQEGHSREVHGLSFHPDGSLLVTGGHDAIGRVWDLRSGRTVMIMDGHIREIYACACSLDGYHVATGGADGKILVWDLRMPGSVYEIPAHNSVITGLCFSEKGPLLSSSYSAEIRLWTANDWRLLKTLKGQGKIMAVDCKEDFQIACGNWNRTLDLYRPT